MKRDPNAARSPSDASGNVPVVPADEADAIDLPKLRAALADLDPEASAAAHLDRLVRGGFANLPMPGSGRTLQRWSALAAVAEHDLSLAKLFEGHTDALAIRHELGDDLSSDDANETWGVWAAEAPDGKAFIDVLPNAGLDAPSNGVIELNGAKRWCSGAQSADRALLTAWFRDGRGPQLVSVSLRQSGVAVESSGWRAVGMSQSASVAVDFDHARARLVGDVGRYLERPGFWHGGAGVAACWYGGAVGIANALRRAVSKAAPAKRDSFRLAALGRVDLYLGSTAALLREAAEWIDAHPHDDSFALVARVRLSAEECARRVLDEVGRALGAAPFCMDAAFARAAADLPVFIRQCHGERDFAALAGRIADAEVDTWSL